MNITLIGMPGAGKSFVGKRLAEKLYFEFLDLDKILEKKYNLPLPEIVEKYGEKDFLDKESSVVIDATNDKDRIVISPGGSVVYRDASMQHLKNISTIIYLDVPLPVLENRIGDVPRGIVGNGVRTFSELYRERTSLYRAWSDHIVDGDVEADLVVKDILRMLNA